MSVLSSVASQTNNWNNTHAIIKSGKNTDSIWISDDSKRSFQNNI